MEYRLTGRGRSASGDVYALYLLTLGTDLDTLGDTLTVPAGWTYSTRALTEPLSVDAGGPATVITTLPGQHLFQKE